MLAVSTPMTRHLYLFAVAALIIFAGSCASRNPESQPRSAEEKPAHAHLTESEAIQIAKRLAKRWGIELSEHAEPTASYQITDRNFVWPYMAEGPNEPSFGTRVWVIHFAWGPKTNYPGGDFFVYVDDKTGRSRLVGGM
jgi:hypothetical protein